MGPEGINAAIVSGTHGLKNAGTLMTASPFLGGYLVFLFKNPREIPGITITAIHSDRCYTIGSFLQQAFGIVQANDTNEFIR
jgi:hypothetical protein